jgi:hypothetical protein
MPRMDICAPEMDLCFSYTLKKKQDTERSSFLVFENYSPRFRALDLHCIECQEKLEQGSLEEAPR